MLQLVVLAVNVLVIMIRFSLHLLLQRHDNIVASVIVSRVVGYPQLPGFRNPKSGTQRLERRV